MRTLTVVESVLFQEGPCCQENAHGIWLRAAWLRGSCAATIRQKIWRPYVAQHGWGWLTTDKSIGLWLKTLSLIVNAFDESVD